jgi:hypothetical protein
MKTFSITPIGPFCATIWFDDLCSSLASSVGRARSARWFDYAGPRTSGFHPSPLAETSPIIGLAINETHR